MSGHCYACKYLHTLSPELAPVEGAGVCTRYPPPVSIRDDEGRPRLSPYPIVAPDASCGEFTPRHDAPTST